MFQDALREEFFVGSLGKLFLREAVVAYSARGFFLLPEIIHEVELAANGGFDVADHPAYLSRVGLFAVAIGIGTDVQVGFRDTGLVVNDVGTVVAGDVANDFAFGKV